MNVAIKFIGVLLLCTCIFLSGCWDQRFLRDHSLVLSVGYDLADEGNIRNTITYPINTENGGGAQGGTPLKVSKTLTATGDTAKDAEKHMDQIIPEKFDRSKARIIMFGKELAEKGFYSTLDSLYRDLRGPLNAKLVIFDGQAKDGLSIQYNQSPLTSDIYVELLGSAENAGITKNYNIQEISPVILQEGKNIILPFVTWKEDSSEVVVKGVSLFHKDKMTGSLNTEETSLLLILMDKITKNLSLNLKVDDKDTDQNKNFVNFAVRNNSRDLKVEAKDGNIKVNIDVLLKVEIDEYAKNHLSKAKEVETLADKTEKRLNERAAKVIEKIQSANSDVLGIGSKVKAYHHEIWKANDWNEEYPDIPIDVNIKVDIVRHGIIN